MPPPWLLLLLLGHLAHLAHLARADVLSSTVTIFDSGIRELGPAEAGLEELVLEGSGSVESGQEMSGKEASDPVASGLETSHPEASDLAASDPEASDPEAGDLETNGPNEIGLEEFEFDGTAPEESGADDSGSASPVSGAPDFSTSSIVTVTPQSASTVSAFEGQDGELASVLPSWEGLPPAVAAETPPPLVWGEVGRGEVAATPDYSRGELGRRPLVLGGKGRTRSGPYFEEEGPAVNLTASAGSTVFLDCRVAMLHDRVVTWAARRLDGAVLDGLRLLTVGRQAYSADRRVALSFRYPNNWRLQILAARRADQGLYECQVAAHPPLIRQVYLAVISPEVSISDESGRAVVERYYKAGSSLQLTCAARQLLRPPSLLGWWQSGAPMLDGISCNVTGPDSATCTLVVEQVTRAHAGAYTCGAFPQDAPDASDVSSSATVAVHVLHGNLIGVAVLPNTGKSEGASIGGYISIQKIILGFLTTFCLTSR